MSNAFIIEVHSNAAGIVVRDGRTFRFFAANRDFYELDGRNFHSPLAAQKAANGHFNSLTKTSHSELRS